MPEEKALDNKFNVSFKNTDEEQQLKNNIIQDSALIGKSAWMKIAAREKLERDKIKNSYVEPTSSKQSTILSNYNQINKDDTKINSMDDLFK